MRMTKNPNPALPMCVHKGNSRPGPLDEVLDHRARERREREERLHKDRLRKLTKKLPVKGKRDD